MFKILSFLSRKDGLGAWMAAVSKPGVGERVAEDEARFLDRSRTRSYVVDERVSA